MINFSGDPFKLIKYIAALAVCVIVAAYAWFQISGSVSSGVETEPAYLTELDKTIDAQGYIFRDETVVPKNSGGTVVTLVSDSQRVSKGEKLAAVYQNDSDTVLQDDINRIQRRINILDKSAVETDYLVSDIEKVDADILQTLNGIYISSESGNLSSAVNYGSDFLIKLNRHELIVNDLKNYDLEKGALFSEKSALESRINSMSTAVYAQSSGYFYGDVDGYENVFKTSLLDTLTIDEFLNLCDSQPDSALVSANAGKIVNDFVWYIACTVPNSLCGGLEEGDYLKVNFPESGDLEINMKLYRIVKENSSAEELLIFRTNVNPEDFGYQRSQRIQIVRGSTEGLTIPKEALRVVDGVKGVYILFGDVVHFRRTEIIGETENYYIISDNDEDYYVFDDDNTQEHTDIKALSLYDNVIVAGKDLFEGKIIG